MVQLLLGQVTKIGPWSVKDCWCHAHEVGHEGWIIEAHVAPPSVHPGSIDRCAGPAACTWLHSLHARHYHVLRLLHELGRSQMVTTIEGLRCIWCNVLGLFSSCIFIQGVVQSGDDADFPVPGTQHTLVDNPSKIPYLYFYHINYIYIDLTCAHFASSVMVLGAFVYWSTILRHTIQLDGQLLLDCR